MYIIMRENPKHQIPMTNDQGSIFQAPITKIQITNPDCFLRETPCSFVDLRVILYLYKISRSFRLHRNSLEMTCMNFNYQLQVTNYFNNNIRLTSTLFPAWMRYRYIPELNFAASKTRLCTPALFWPSKSVATS